MTLQHKIVTKLLGDVAVIIFDFCNNMTNIFKITLKSLFCIVFIYI